jgi:hypothetical protein
MSSIKAEIASVARLQFLNPLLLVCYLLAVLGPMTFRFTEDTERFQHSLRLSLWFTWSRAYLKGGGGGNISRRWRRLASYFWSVEGSVHLLVKVLHKLRDPALWNSFLLRVDKPTASDVGCKGGHELWC